MDTAVRPGSTYVYTAVAVAGGVTSAPSNGFTATIPVTPPALTPTLIGTSTRVVNGTLTSVSVTVTANGKPVTEGTVTWTVGGRVFFQDTLTKKGQDTENVWSIMLNNLPVTVGYNGSSIFASSSTTVGGPK